MMSLPRDLDIRADSLALVDWEEGTAGQVQSWLEASGLGHVACFVHAEDVPPSVDPVAARKGRHASQFDVPSTTHFKGRPLISARDWPAALKALGIQRVIVVPPDLKRRQEEIEAARRAGLTLVNAIHPTALIMPDAIIGESIVMHARAYVGYRAEIRDGVVLNVGVQVDHHSVVDTCATLDPAAVMAGNCYVGPRARLHTGATLKNRIRVGADAIVGAGTVVIRDVEPGWKVVGNPARRIG
jgi:sugar O-acyltransferase (sialic acid O-acetyltransferase NeuD family)